MRNKFADVFYELAVEDPRLALVVADISPAGSIARFRTEFPQRFVNTGVAEQVMIGITAGMALRGMRPFAYTIATFALFRPFEFVRDDLCYHDLPVTVVGIGGGVTYSALGGTHHAMEDVAVAGAIPGMQVFAPCDPFEAEAVTRHLARDNLHPAYLRMGKAGEPDLSAKAPDPFRIGKLRRLTKGADVCILGYGPILKLGFDLAEALAARGQSTTICSVHSVKPLDDAAIVEMLRAHQRIVVLEEMVPRGGLSDAVIRLAYEAGLQRRIDRFTLQDKFIHCYGSHQDVLGAHGLTVAAMAERLGL